MSSDFRARIKASLRLESLKARRGALSVMGLPFTVAVQAPACAQVCMCVCMLRCVYVYMCVCWDGMLGCLSTQVLRTNG